MSKSNLKDHTWVRVKNGVYEGDLGLIEFISGTNKAFVRMIPRMRTEIDLDKGKEVLNVATKYHKGESKIIRIPQKFFNPSNVKSECKKEKYGPNFKSYYKWQENYFRNGFLFLMMPINKLQADGVNPRLEEV